jgi:hypothetical protein
MADYYDTLIVQRGGDVAARLLADECRKKDAELTRLRELLPAEWDRLNLLDTELEQLRELVRLLGYDDFAAPYEYVAAYRAGLAQAVGISWRGADKSRGET